MRANEMNPLNKVNVAGVKFVATNARGAVDHILRNLVLGNPCSFHFMNAYSVVLVSKSQELQRVADSSTVFADGKPVAWFARRDAGLRQVRGPQAFEDVLSDGRRDGIRHYLLGGSSSTLELLQKEIKEKFPGVIIAGAFSPPYHDLTQAERREQDERIVACGPDVVWVGLGTPKQDFEAYRIARDLRIPAAAVGAAFDFTAGTKRVAPRFLRALGLEWLFRLATEPRRLWRRYLIGNIQFLCLVMSKSIERRG